MHIDWCRNLNWVKGRKKLQSESDVNVRQLQYSGADKSLSRPGRKQATAREDFDVRISYL